MKIYIYKIYFYTSKKCYIGQTNNMERRMFQHLENRRLVGNALRKYEDWQVSILHTCKTRDEANRIEIEEIRNFNCVAPNGYNLTRGGEGLSNPSKNTRKKMSVSAKKRGISKETIEKIRIASQGKLKSKEHKNKIGVAHKGKHHSKETIEKIRKSKQGLRPSKEAIEKMKIAHQGRYNSNSHSVGSEIKRLKTRIKKLEQDL